MGKADVEKQLVKAVNREWTRIGANRVRIDDGCIQGFDSFQLLTQGSASLRPGLYYCRAVGAGRNSSPLKILKGSQMVASFPGHSCRFVSIRG